MSPDLYLAYLAVLAAFFATPPDVSQLLVMSNSLRHGVRRSLWTVAGDLSANTLQMIAAGLGLTAVIASSAGGLTVLKWAGVAYLLWLGVRRLLARAPAGMIEGGAAARAGALFRQGFLTSAANPYAVIFFGALFPQFIDPARPLVPQLLILGGTYLAVDGLLLIAWGAVAVRAFGRVRAGFGRWADRISGALMIGADRKSVV